MALDLDLYRQKLLDRRAELQREDESVVADRAPVALDQESVGRLSRIDALQVQAMALAQPRRRQSERNATAEYGRASLRESVGKYGEDLWVAVSLKKK